MFDNIYSNGSNTIFLDNYMARMNRNKYNIYICYFIYSIEYISNMLTFLSTC